MAIKTHPWDAAEFLDSDEAVAEYLTLSLESNDIAEIAHALGTIAKARGGIAKLARQTGITCEALHRALSENGNPEFATVLKVMHALGVKLSASMVA
jgi:probable addiction module antidote protein